VDADGGAARHWSEWGGAGRPSWSHDGRWIYFGEKDAAEVFQVFKISTTDPKQRVQVTKDGAFEAFESADGNILYYVHDEQLRRMPADGGAWAAVTDRRVNMGWWSVAKNGVYFVDMTSTRRFGRVDRGEKPILFLEPATGAIRRVGSIAGDVKTALPDFCVSPDGKALYYSVLEVSVSQIRMLEGGL
jgi:hypothetical protein